MYQYGGWSNMRMQPPQQQAALPRGWEPKWDPNTKRHFYVDHNTKTTHWELPTMRQPSPTPQRVTTSFINGDPDKANILLSEYEGVDREYIKNLLRIYQNNLTSVRQNLDRRGYKKKKAAPPQVEPKSHFVSSLKRQYPAAGEDVIKQVLVSTNNNFVGARTALEAMGYKRKIEQSVKDTDRAQKAVPKAKESKTAASISTSSDLSEAEKNSRLEQLKKKFPTVAESVVELSLVGTMYDVNMAAEILKSSIDSVKTKASAAASSTSTSRPARTKPKETPKTKSPERKPASYAPVVFGSHDSKTDDHKPDAASTSTVNVTSQASRSTSSSEYKKREYKAPPRKVYPRQNRAPVTGYKSANRCEPMGPDPKLVNGPDASLLSTQLIKAMGPNRSNRMGPQRLNRCGPLPSNAQGRAGIDVGPMHAHLVHSAV